VRREAQSNSASASASSSSAVASGKAKHSSGDSPDTPSTVIASPAWSSREVTALCFCSIAVYTYIHMLSVCTHWRLALPARWSCRPRVTVKNLHCSTLQCSIETLMLRCVCYLVQASCTNLLHTHLNTAPPAGQTVVLRRRRLRRWRRRRARGQ
jgi:hypothetical protein